MGEHGQGNVTRRADGRLMVTMTMPGGRRIFRYVRAMDDLRRQRREAEAIRRELVDARDRDLNPERQTLADYLRSWIKGLRRDRHQRVRPRTIEHYAYIVEDYIIPALGGHRLDRLSARHVQRWLDDDTGSAQSIHHHRAVLRRALNVAKRQRILAHNPAVDVDLPTVREFRGAPLTSDEARALFRSPDRLAPLWRLAVATGLREAELLGLAWDDVDLERGTVLVHNQLARVEGAWAFVPTKAARTRELLHVDAGTVAVLVDHKRRMVAERTPEWRYFGLVFVTPKGNPIGRSDVLRAFHEACEAAGIPRRRFHDLRGSSATLLAEAGVAEDVRMGRLGHATTRMARHYAPVRDDVDREAAAALGRLLG